MILFRIESSLRKKALIEKAQANLRWFQLFRPMNNPVFPRITGHLYGSFFTATVLLGHMNSFKPVFYGRLHEVRGKSRIVGFFAWPIGSIVMFSCLIGFVLLQFLINNSAGKLAGTGILGIFLFVWLLCKFLARKQKSQIQEYLTWLTTNQER